MVKSKYGDRPTDPDSRQKRQGAVSLNVLDVVAAYLGVPGGSETDEETNRTSFNLDLKGLAAGDTVEGVDAEGVEEAAQQSSVFTDVVQGVQDVSRVIQEAQDFVPSTSLRLLDDLTRRYSPAQKLNEMFADIRIMAPAMSARNEPPVSPFLQDPDQSPLNDFINMMRQMSAR